MKIFQLNENDYYKGNSIEEVIAVAMSETGMSRKELLDDFTPTQLTEAALDRLTYCDGDTPPAESPGWKCEAVLEGGRVCGCMIAATADPHFRWNGTAWEHYHPYPVGHVVMTEYRERTFREQLALETVAGDNEPGIFASSEY